MQANIVMRARDAAGVVTLYDPETPSMRQPPYQNTTIVLWSPIEVSGGGVYPIANDVRSGIDYGPNGSDYNGDLELPVVADVKTGVKYGADGIEFTGTLPSGGSTYSRSRVVSS